MQVRLKKLRKRKEKPANLNLEEKGGGSLAYIGGSVQD